MKKINIPLSDQVVDLETARELTEKLASVGIDVEANSWWGEDVEFKVTHYTSKYEAFRWCYAHKITETYTLPELLAVLPYSIPNRHKANSGCEWGVKNNCAYYGRCSNSQLTIEKIYKYSYDIGYTCQEHTYVSIISIVHEDRDLNPATAAAKLLIWCIDNGYIKGGGE